jgi:chromosomal replication initiator protein
MVAIKETNEHLGSISEPLPGEESAALELLNKARTILKKRLSFFVWQGFFEPLSAVSLSKNQLILEAPTSFHRNWVMDHYMAELNGSVTESFGEEIKVIINFSNEPRKRISPKKSEKLRSKASAPQEAQTFEVSDTFSEKEPDKKAPVLPIINHSLKPDMAVLPIAPNSNLNPTYSFEAFVQGPSNQMGFAAAVSVAEHPGTQFSPLFLFGGVGLGKTHLMHAIGFRAKERNSTLKIVYLSAEQWVNSYIQAIRERQFDLFRHRYRNGCDILLIDDIQFLAGKDASQDEFFHTFNCLHEAKKQIVVTSDKYPHEIDGLEERLQTRLSWGLIADIRPPEIETRIAILHKKAESLSVKLSDEVLGYLAAHVTSSVRELEGALVRVATCSALSRENLSLNQAKEILSPVIKRNTVVISWQKVCEAVASYYDLRTSDLIGQSRQRQVVFARQVAMSLCRSMLSLSLPEIGRVFGGRDHSTVLSSLRKIEEHKRIDVSMQSLLHKFEDKIAALANS